MLSLIATAVASVWALHLPRTCADIPAFSGAISVRGPIESVLPIPVVQNCSGGAVTLAVILVLGCTLATFAWQALLRAGISQRVAMLLYAVAAAVAVSFPYVSTTDAYAYALYGYEAGVQHRSPYRAQPLQTNTAPEFSGIARLFPDERSGVRIANYGPVFTALYGGVAAASRGSLKAAIVIERLLSAIALLTAALLLRRGAFVALAPLCVFELIAFAHNDAAMLAFLALAWAAYRKNQLAWCCAAIVLAGEVKGIALLAFLPLALHVARNGRLRAAAAAFAGAAATLAITAALSLWAFGTFSLGGAPAIAPFSSPSMLLAAAAGGSLSAIKIFGALQIVAGLLLAAWLFLRRRTELGAAAAMASLPALFPWYFTWLVPLGAITRDRAFRSAVVAAAFVSILGEIPLMVANAGLAVAALVLAVQWGVPALTYASALNSDARRRVRRSAVPSDRVSPKP
ncbi:MAG TPA: hypothetical protein VGZ02_11390 [Candidatus Baltobacteraceae bacterium]|nr:hypothetical protein [Candidatus Baltobacteraceae bacterium]